MEFLLVLAILVAVVYIVTGPLRRPEAASRVPGSVDRDGEDGDRFGVSVDVGRAEAAHDLERESELDELEAAREAKYREIRDTQLDFDTGKLSREDFQALDGGLRREALEVLQRIDALQAPSPAAGDSEPAEPGLRERE